MGNKLSIGDIVVCRKEFYSEELLRLFKISSIKRGRLYVDDFAKYDPHTAPRIGMEVFPYTIRMATASDIAKFRIKNDLRNM